MTKGKYEELIEELPELRRDKARLDWIIKQGPPGAAEGIGLNEEAWESACCEVKGEGEIGNDDSVLMRRAIDAAMERSAK